MERKLMCSAINCVNNVNGLCSAYIINIQDENASNSHETYCNTFAEKGIINAVENMFNMNVVGEVKQVFTNESVEMSPEIKCQATKCIYNSHYMCKAEHVQVSGKGNDNKEETNCETFKM